MNKELIEGDGVNFINISPQATTELGKWLSPFAEHAPIIVEGTAYSVKTLEAARWVLKYLYVINETPTIDDALKCKLCKHYIRNIVAGSGEKSRYYGTRMMMYLVNIHDISISLFKDKNTIIAELSHYYDLLTHDTGDNIDALIKNELAFKYIQINEKGKYVRDLSLQYGLRIQILSKIKFLRKLCEESLHS